MDIRVRPADSYDIEEVARLMLAPYEKSRDYNSDLRRTIKGLSMMAGSSEERTVLVAEKNESIIGAVTGQLLISAREGGLSALVEDLCVEAREPPGPVRLKLLGTIKSWARSLGASRILFLAHPAAGAEDGELARGGWPKDRQEVRRYTNGYHQD